MSEQYTNLARTNLSAGIDDNDLTITVLDETLFPTTATYRIVIDREIMIVTAGAGTDTWTVTRGAEGTTAVAHSSGAPVVLVLTVQSLLNIREEATELFAFASPPSNHIKGRRLISTNRPSVQWHDDGTDYIPVLPVYTPAAQAFDFTSTSNNLGTSGVNTDAWLFGGVLHVNTYASANPKFWKKNKPGGNYKYTLCLRMDTASGDADAGTGIVLYESGSGKYRAYYYNGGNLKVNNFNADHTFNSNNFNTVVTFQPSQPFYIQFEDNGSNFIYRYSLNGTAFTTIQTLARTTFITPDQIGFCVVGSASYTVAAAQCLGREIV